MRILVVNPNTSEEMTRDIAEQAARYARPDTELETVAAPWGPRSIEGHYEEHVAAVATLEAIGRRAGSFDAVVIACFGDPGLYAAREVSPVPVIGIAEAALLMACTVSYRFSVVTVLPRVRPLIEETVRRVGLESRCASVRTTPLSVLDCERDPDAARPRDRHRRPRGGRGGRRGVDLPRLRRHGAARPPRRRRARHPVLDGVACAIKLAEGVVDYGLSTSRVAAFRAPEPKEIVGYPAGVPA